MRPDGEPQTAQIESLAHDGRGVAHVDGKTVYVDGALPGERVVLRRTRSRRRYDEAVTVEVLEAAAGRVAPRCEHYGVCGGCSLQHLDPALQVVAKQGHVAEQLSRLGRVEPQAWLEPLTGPVWHYRRRARLGVKFVHKKGRVLVGFRERAAPFVADLRKCHVLAHPVGELIEALAAMIGDLSIRERLPQIEVAVGEGATALVMRVLDAPAPADLERLRTFAATHGVDIYLQPGGLDTIAPLEPSTTPLHYRLPAFDLTIGFRPVDFIQVNGELNERTVARTVSLLDPQPADAILDLFCGLGNFTL
ncbi:MAG: TRAM domain-containing protein, partial [Betaproteobacteria bacterium]|nr:TRAM domain-containing protein [Betaproteobacteria bacterium]